jgi:thiol-disulfide isomerase/thioredoxin
MSNFVKAASIKALSCALGLLVSSLFCPAVLCADEERDSDRVLVVFVFDKSCRISCDAVRPIFRQLKSEYGEKVKFVELDVSKDVIGESQKTAKALKVNRFLDDTEDWYPAVGVFTGNRKKVKEILGAKPRDQYVQAIEKALVAQQKEGTTDKGKQAMR